MNLLRFIGGVLLSAAIITFAIVRIAFEVLGASTSPDDFALLKQRMPDILRWLFTTPWPVPTLIVLAATVVAGWLLWSGSRKTAQAAAEAGVDEERLRELIRLEIAAIHASQNVPAGNDVEAVSKPRNITKLTEIEKERVNRSLLAVHDYLGGDFEDQIGPLRDILDWPRILQNFGPAGLLDKSEWARACARNLGEDFNRAITPHNVELELVGVIVEDLKPRMATFDDALHSVGSVAYAMKPDEPNEAAVRLSGEMFTRTFSELEQYLDRLKGEITEARRRLAKGELG